MIGRLLQELAPLPMKTILILLMTTLGAHALTPQTLQARMEVQVCHSAVEIFRVKEGRLPTPEEGLKAITSMHAGIKLVDPWGHPYAYLRGDGLPDGFGIYSMGPDGISSTQGNDSDDLNSWTSSAPDPHQEKKKWLMASAGACVLAIIIGFVLGMLFGRRPSGVMS